MKLFLNQLTTFIYKIYLNNHIILFIATRSVVRFLFSISYKSKQTTLV